MIDNWTLQDIEALLTKGLDPTQAAEISIADDRKEHLFSPIPAGAIQIDALLTLLTNIVCFDELTVDDKFVQTWRRDAGFLAPLEHVGIIRPDNYDPLRQNLTDIREVMLDELCVTESLRTAMREVKRQWEESRAQPDPHLSALVWGGAGMLARSHLTSTPYFGHPTRRRLIAETRMFTARPNSTQRFEAFVNTERAKMFRYRGERFGGSIGEIILPPIPVRVIEEATSLHDLISVAVQIRDQHAELRKWLTDYQWAIGEEDEKKQIRFERMLTSVGKSIQVRYGSEKAGSLGISLSAAFIKMDAPRALLDGVLNSFGVRATLVDLILAPRGQHALNKLLGMFGEAKSALGRKVLTSCLNRYGKTAT